MAVERATHTLSPHNPTTAVNKIFPTVTVPRDGGVVGCARIPPHGNLAAVTLPASCGERALTATNELGVGSGEVTVTHTATREMERDAVCGVV